MSFISRLSFLRLTRYSLLGDRTLIGVSRHGFQPLTRIVREIEPCEVWDPELVWVC